MTRHEFLDRAVLPDGDNTIGGWKLLSEIEYLG
jgi:hypothetical protein